MPHRRTPSFLPGALALLLGTAAISPATILTFEEFTASNTNVRTMANPFGAGEYGSRASSAVNAGFQVGDGWTPGVTLAWGVGFQSYIGWPFGNNSTTAPGGVAQIDYDTSAQAPIDLTFTPDAGLGVRLNSFAFTVWDSSPQLPVQIRWTVHGGAAGTGPVLATGISDALGAAGGAHTIQTGLTTPHAASTPVVLRLEKLSGDGTYMALNNVDFSQGAAGLAPVLTWDAPGAIIAGTPLGAAQLNASADVPGTFTYSPTAGTVLDVGVHQLRADFAPQNTQTHTVGSVTTTILVKADALPVVTTAVPQQVAAGEVLTPTLLGASADVAGAFSAVPAFGTVLTAGPHAVTLTFTPADSVFTTVTRNVTFDAVESVLEGTVWKFSDTSNRLRPLFGNDTLTAYDPAGTGWAADKIVHGTASGFGLPLPTGGDMAVMSFAHTLATEGLRLAFDDAPNGSFIDSGWTSNYTLVFDVLWPSGGANRPLYNTNLANANGAEAFVNASDALQTASLAYGSIQPGVWHRIAVVVRAASAEGQAHLYVDGTFIGGIGSNDSTVSASYALEEALLLLTSNTGNHAPGFLGGLRFIGRNLDYAEVHALGGVHAAGPHVPGPAAPAPPYQPLRDVLIIGHRGNSGFAPEDTLPSFLTAFAAGADAVEVDIRLTADNRVIAMHDSSVERTTDVTGAVASKTLAQLQALDAGSWFGPQFAGTPPPALREIMAAVKDAYPQAILYLDVKVNGIASRIKDDADATGFPVDRIWFWNYNSTSEAAAVRAVFPSAKLIWGESNWANGASIGTWPTLSPAQKQAVADAMKARGVFGFDFGDNEMNSLNPTTLQELRAAGFLVSAYTALHPASMTRAVENHGVDAMETDFPAVLRALMPEYTATTSALALSDGAVQVDHTAFPNPPLGSDVRLRHKPKAAPPTAWTDVLPAQDARARRTLVTGLAPATLHEFQPILWQNGRPVAFGSVTDATTLSAGQNFAAAWAAWQAAHPGVGAPDADTDGDGVSNLLEFATGNDPLQATDGGAVLTTLTSSSLRYRRQAGTYLVWDFQASTDLAGWQTLLPGAEWQESAISSGPLLDVMEVTLPVPSTPQRFVRAVVTPLP